MKKIVGVDYSMTSPSICVCVGDFKFENCKFFFRTKEKKKAINTKQFFGLELNDFTCNEQRFLELAIWAETVICPTKDTITFIEGYSFASKGMVFQIGECVGALKSRLYQSYGTYEMVSPSSVKKFATGLGNAKKEDMLRAFTKHTGTDLERLFDVRQRKNKSPACDIADSYFICWLGAHTEAQRA